MICSNTTLFCVDYADPELGAPRERLESTVEELDPVTLTWKDVNVYSIPKKGCCNRGAEEPKHILKTGQTPIPQENCFLRKPIRAYRKIRFNITMTVKQGNKNCYNDFKFVIMNFRIRSNGLSL